MAKSAGAAPRKPQNKRKTSSSSHTRLNQTPMSSPVAAEVKHLAAAALGILLLISVYVNGAAGMVGAFIRALAVGFLGAGAYVLPAAVIAASIYALFSDAKRVPPAFMVKTALFFWCVLSFIHITTVKEIPASANIFQYFADLFNQAAVTNGGLLGGLLGNLLRSLLGAAGAYIILVTGGMIVLVLLTGRTFTNLLPRAVERTRRYIASARETYEENPSLDLDAADSERPEPPRAARRSHDAPAARKDPKVYDIQERTDRPPNRVLLVSEEARRVPARAVKPAFTAKTEYSPVIDIHTREPVKTDDPPPWPEEETPPGGRPIFYENFDIQEDIPEDILEDIPDIEAAMELPEEWAEEDPGITVKGLVEQSGVSPGQPPFDTAGDYDLFPPPDVVEASAPPKKKAGAAPVPAVEIPLVQRYEGYEFPPISLLTKNTAANPTGSRTQILENSRILEETLRSFRVEARVVEVSVGPTVTRYDLAPGAGVKVSSIANLSNDLALSLAAQGIRIEAPIPGKAAVGIEIPNKEPQPVLVREIIEDDIFQKFSSRLAFAVGKDIAGSPVVADIGRMPHLLIAGATGAGKSIFINTLITSLLYKSRPDEVKLLMVDPKVVELSVYNGIPHLLIPVVTDPKKASGALQWAVAEMEKRYMLFAGAGVRDLKGYNVYLGETADETEESFLPQIVIIIDELADLMMTCKGEVEDSICRLAQKARAAGIHLVVATQRPSVDVITGLIKANIPSRLAFAVSSGIDSRTVLDMYGAEKLLGKGDMLFLPAGQAKPTRLQGGFISDKEVESIVDFLKAQQFTEYPEDMIEKVTVPSKAGTAPGGEDLDEYFNEAVEFLIEKGKASTTLLQKRFRIGYNRASRLMDDLEARGIVGPEDGVKPRKILITWDEYQNEF